MKRFKMPNQMQMEIFVILYKKYKNLPLEGRIKQGLQIKIKMKSAAKKYFFMKKCTF